MTYGATENRMTLWRCAPRRTVDPPGMDRRWHAGRCGPIVVENRLSTSLRFPFACLANKRRKVAITPVAVEKLFSERFNDELRS
jgi:hypothetical protein